MAANGGAGGAATSSLDAANEGGGALVMTSEAIGGTGALPSIYGVLAGMGGSAVASARGVGAGSSSVDVTATARGGLSGSSVSYLELGVDGGLATLGEVSGRSDAGGSVRVHGQVFGGYGGANGRGADAVLTNAVTGSTSGALTLAQTAVAGSGAKAGSAQSTLDFSTDSLSLELHSESRGGGEFSFVPANPTDGVASSIARAENLGGSAAAFALAEGFIELGYPYYELKPIGSDAAASAFARSVGDHHDVTVGALPSATGPRQSGAYGANGFDAYVSGAAGLNGGAATSDSQGVAEGDSAVHVFDEAVAGDGGQGNGGIGGSGGTAVSSATGRNTGDSAVVVRAEAVGGRGGFATTAGGSGGTATASASGSSSGAGSVDVTAIQRGGAGNLYYGPTVTGGRGADSNMRDAVTGSSGGLLSLLQRAVGGDGGTGRDAAAGGSASSDLTAANPGGGAIAAVVEAMAGSGAYGISAFAFPNMSVGGTGGAAHAATTAEALGASAASATARAVAGAGGGANGTAGDGGTATLGPIFARSESGDVAVTGEATGGNGGSGTAGGGSGASVLLDNAVRGETSGALTLVQRATGGDAGSIDYYGTTGSAGRAGSAVSHIEQMVAATRFSVTSTASGGDGANKTITGDADAAAAESSVSATNEAGALDVVARAKGGDTFGSNVPAAGGNATVSVLARTLGDGHDIRVGEAFAANPAQSAMGAIAGRGGVVLSPHGGGGNASSTSSGVALGDSRVEVNDLAIGGFSALAGGDANSSASAVTGGRSLALARSLAIAGNAFGEGNDAVARANAQSSGEVQASADARGPLTAFSSTPPLTSAVANASGVGASGSVSASARSGSSPNFGALVATQAFALAPVLTEATASARAGGGALPSSASLTTGADATAWVAGAATQMPVWGSAALALDDTQARDPSNITLRAEAEFSGATSGATLAAGLYVTFLSLDADQADFEQLALRIRNGTNGVLERVFTNPSDAVEFFSQPLLLTGLTSTSSRFPGAFDLDVALEMTSDHGGTRFGTIFALGTAVVPEPGTGTLMLLGLVVVAVARRTRRRAS